MKELQKERFMKLYLPINDRFERFCKARSYGIMDFKDLMHDTLLIAFEKLELLKNEGAFLHFLFGTASKLLANQRKKKRPIYTNQLHTLEYLYLTKKEHGYQFEVDNLYLQLSKLDEKTRECIILFEISGFSILEIMTIQKSSESAVKQRLKRGRSKLLALIQSSEHIKIKSPHEI
jgi:RNA polymerase sigma-70 factor (ECF subfamily)